MGENQSELRTRTLIKRRQKKVNGEEKNREQRKEQEITGKTIKEDTREKRKTSEEEGKEVKKKGAEDVRRRKVKRDGEEEGGK
jgi:hypothetical protein